MGFVCVECGASVPLLVRDYGGGDKNIHLCICEHCNQICDKYVEYEPFLLFLDLMLFKHQVYRHVLYNRSTPFSLVRKNNVFLCCFLRNIVLFYHRKRYGGCSLFS